MNYQWYPGHMTKAVRQMQEDIKLIDLIIEIVDARLPISSRNPDINKFANGKSRIVLLNKSDLSDPSMNKIWCDYFKENGIGVLLTDSRKKATLKELDNLIKETCKEKIERDLKRGIKNRPLRAMVVGIPNCGKSTFINSFAGKSVAKTGNKPGVTKGKQWIRLNKTLELLDTPGILWPKFESQTVGERLAMIGSINDEIIPQDELAYAIIAFLRERYKGVIEDRYGIEPEADCKDFEILEKIAISRNLLKKNAEPDLQRAAAIVIDEFRGGRLGRITLDRPKEEL